MVILFFVVFGITMFLQYGTGIDNIGASITLSLTAGLCASILYFLTESKRESKEKKDDEQEKE